MSREGKSTQSWVRLSSLGIELAAAVAGFALIGHLVDRFYGTTPWGLAIGASLGVVGGLYNFIRTAIQAYRESFGQADGEQRDDDEPRG